MPKELRVMQMIDSLSIGGAERVSVNYANALAELGYKSFHCATREEGMLKEFLRDDVEFFYMDKRSFLDKKAYKKLIVYIREHNITIIHAHSSSFFTAVLIKLFTGIKIVWHDHYGKSEALNERSLWALKIGSLFFSYVISVNTLLKDWACNNLFISKEKIAYFPNYADLDFKGDIPKLPGVNGKRIIVLANLRAQKDHLNMLKAFKIILEDVRHKQWQLLFVGRDWDDAYSKSIKVYITTHNMSENVSILGGRSDTAQILKLCDIGVLSSESEGLPVALLEYALASLAVVSTNVGECNAVTNEGKVAGLVPAKDERALAKVVLKLISDKEFRKLQARDFNEYVEKNYSKKTIFKKIVEVYKSL